MALPARARRLAGPHLLAAPGGRHGRSYTPLVTLKRVVLGTTAVVLGALVALLAVAVRDSLGSDSFVKAINAGRRPVAPTFELQHLAGGGRLGLDDLRGRPVVVNFWASWCPPCRDEADGLEQFAQEYRARGVAFVGVDGADTVSSARAFARRYGLSYPLLRDRGESVKRRWGVGGYPETFVLDGSGRAVAWFNGPVDGSDEVRARFRQALAQAGA